MPNPSFTRYHRVMGRLFVVVAEFDDTDDGATKANEYMAANPGIGVLEVIDGKVILASNSDEGLVMSSTVLGLKAEVVKPEKTFSHAYTLSFEVSASNSEDGSDVTEEEMFMAIMLRTKELFRQKQLLQAVGSAFDTHEVQS